MDPKTRVQEIATWLKNITEAMPSDGNLTNAVLTEVGPLPVHVGEPITSGKSAEDIVRSRRLAAVGALAYSQGSLRTMLRPKIDQAMIDAHELRTTDPTGAEKAAARHRYLEQVRDYVARLR
jgi:hypothetical protein